MELLSNCCGARVDGLNADNIGICSECKEGCGVEEVESKQMQKDIEEGNLVANLKKKKK